MDILPIYVVAVAMLVIVIIGALLKYDIRRTKKRIAAKREFLTLLNQSDIETVKNLLVKVGFITYWNQNDRLVRFCGANAFKSYAPIELAGVIGSLLHNDIITYKEVVESIFHLNLSEDDIKNFTKEAGRRHYMVQHSLDWHFEKLSKEKKTFQIIQNGIKVLKK
jgi:hypothetical protein